MNMLNLKLPPQATPAGAALVTKQIKKINIRFLNKQT